ncbi:MAG: LuxR C-terminal-related transcriptional regulator [Micromonosporaceae bacterium]
MVMVGRAVELRELLAVWSAVAGGPTPSDNPTGAVGSRTAVVTGDAGSGRTKLVSTALAEFVPRPAVVLSGTARVHSPSPYDWLAAVLSVHEPDRHGVAPDAYAWLAQHPDAPRQRYAPDGLLRMAVRIVRALVAGGPTVLLVEDLHALDPASLNLVAELAADPELPALLLVTSRAPNGDGGLVDRTLSRLCGTPGSVRTHLNPLGPLEVSELIRHRYGPVPDPVAEAVAARTGGNPYRLTELLATTRDLTDLAPEPPSRPDLTTRETEVLSCLASGMSNKQIARSLGISVRTVGVHVSSLLRKTGSASRTEAALWAVRHQPATRT